MRLGSAIVKVFSSLAGFEDRVINLGIGDNVSEIYNSTELQDIAGLIRIPHVVTSRDVQELAKSAAFAQAQAELISDWSREAITQANAQANAYNTRATHAASMMRINNRIAKTQERLNRSQRRYAHNMAVTRNQVQGYQAAYEKSMSIYSPF